MPNPIPVFVAQGPAFPPGGAMLPLQGVTVLVVEDSRFASEAIRLMCQRTGARLRRAETLDAARRHLAVYRPDAVIVDLGLPDGRGEWLIADLGQSASRPGLILGVSGETAGREAAISAGADGFLEKPLASLAAFVAALAPLARFMPLIADDDALPPPDPLALHDDLIRAARLVSDGPDAVGRRYLNGFLTGIARQTQDDALAEAAGVAERGGRMDRLSTLISTRLHREDAAFRRPRN